MKSNTKVIQISNIAPQATKDQLHTFFGYIGKVEDIRLFPTVRDVAVHITSRMCFIKFYSREDVMVAQHVTNTVFIDRAIVVVPFLSGEVPDEKDCLEIFNSYNSMPGLPPEAKWPAHITNVIDGIILRTIDPLLTENNLPEYPNLPATTETCKVNEIRRTLIFDNMDVEASNEEVLAFIEKAGPVKYFRKGTEENGFVNYLVEFAQQGHLIDALKMNKELFKGYPIKVSHSTVAIIKPQTKSNDYAIREIEDAMRRVKEAQNFSYTSNMDPFALIEAVTKEIRLHSRSRSKSRSRHNSRSRSRRQSRSKSHRSPSRSRRHRSRSHHRASSKRSKSRSRRSTSRSRRDKDRKRDDKKSEKDRKESHESKAEHTSKRTNGVEKKDEKSSRSHRSKSRDRKSQRTRSRSRDRKHHRSRSREIRSRRSSSRSGRNRSSRSHSLRHEPGRSADKFHRRPSPASPTKAKRRHRSGSRDKKDRREKEKDKHRDKKDKKDSSVSRNYDDEEQMTYAETAASKKHQGAVDMDISP